MINFNKINQSDLEIAADRYYSVMLDYLHEQEEETRIWTMKTIDKGMKLEKLATQQGDHYYEF